MIEEADKPSESGRAAPKPDIAAEHERLAARRGPPTSNGNDVWRSWIQLLEAVGGKLAYGVGFLILVLVVLALVLFRGDDAGAPSNERGETPTEIDEDGPATPEPDNIDAVTPVPEFVAADSSTPLGGTWVMYWRSSEGTDSAAFTLQFNGVNGGSVEVLNDETESDTWIEFEGDDVRFGFTRTFQAPASWPAGAPFPAEGWDEASEFQGTRVSDGQFLGTWSRDDWECRPDLTPPCSTEPDPASYTAWIEQQP